MLDDLAWEAEATIRVPRRRHAAACHDPGKATNLTLPLERIAQRRIDGRIGVINRRLRL
jgi:hypothetical protein